MDFQKKISMGIPRGPMSRGPRGVPDLWQGVYFSVVGGSTLPNPRTSMLEMIENIDQKEILFEKEENVREAHEIFCRKCGKFGSKIWWWVKYLGG